MTKTPHIPRFESLYVHVPFCAAKCAYCAFYSVPGAGESVRRQYLARLFQEFDEFAAPRGLGPEPLASVFLGGGTPTLLEPRELETLLRGIRARIPLRPDLEFTTECNPETLTEEKAAILAAWGVNRVSIGAQSFAPSVRARLGRGGDAARIGPAIRALRRHGIGNIGLDLIYGIPGQSRKEWESDLRTALAFGPRHLSTYALTIEEGSRLAGDASLPAPDDGEAAEMWEAAEAVAAEAGLRRYEVSNFAAPGFECRHNLATWFGGTCLGCGPAAWSFDGAVRWGNPGSLDEWLKPEFTRETDRIPPEARAAEILLFGLRTADGWDPAGFRERTGFDLWELRGPQIRALEAAGLLETSDGRLRPTRRGLLFNDAIGRELL